MMDLSIVIISWNTRDLLRDCLDSVFNTTIELTTEVFVVDNNSSDGSQKAVRDAYPQVKLIENTENVGFAKANNQAFPLCSSQYILLLNSDTRVTDGALKMLVNFMDTHPEAGAVGPKLIHPETSSRFLSCGYQPTLRTLFNQYFFLSHLFPRWHVFRGTNLLIGVHDDQPRAVEWLSGACFLVRRSVIDQVGPLSEQWFMYAEDMEWCDRIISHGWLLYHVPSAIVEHWHGASSNQNSTTSTMWIHSLRTYFLQRKNPCRLSQLLFDIVLILGLALRATLYTVLGTLHRKQRIKFYSNARRYQLYTRAALQASLKG